MNRIERYRYFSWLKITNRDGRRFVAKKLGQDEGNFTLLVKKLRHRNSGIRSGVAEALGHLKNSAAVEPLIEQLNDSNCDVRAAAVWALGQIGDIRAAKPISEKLEDEDQVVSRTAVEALGSIGSASSIEPLCKFLIRQAQARNISDEEILKALERIGKPKAIKPIIQAVIDKGFDVEKTLAVIDPHWASTDEARAMIPSLVDAAFAKRSPGKDGYKIDSILQKIEPGWATHENAGTDKFIASLAEHPLWAIRGLDKISPDWVKSKNAQGALFLRLNQINWEDGWRKEEEVELIVDSLRKAGAIAGLCQALQNPIVRRFIREREQFALRPAIVPIVKVLGDFKNRRGIKALVKLIPDAYVVNKMQTEYSPGSAESQSYESYIRCGGIPLDVKTIVESLDNIGDWKNSREVRAEMPSFKKKALADQDGYAIQVYSLIDENLAIEALLELLDSKSMTDFVMHIIKRALSKPSKRIITENLQRIASIDRMLPLSGIYRRYYEVDDVRALANRELLRRRK